MSEREWEESWARLRAVFLKLGPEDRREVEFYAAYLAQKAREHARRSRLPDEEEEE